MANGQELDAIEQSFALWFDGMEEDELRWMGRHSYLARDFAEVAALLDARAHLVREPEWSDTADAAVSRRVGGSEPERVGQWLLEYAVVVWGRACAGPGNEGEGVAERAALQPWLEHMQEAAVTAGVASKNDIQHLLADLKRVRDKALAHVDGSAMPIEHNVPPRTGDGRVRVVSSWMQPEIRHLLVEIDIALWRRVVQFHLNMPSELLPEWARPQ